MYHSINIKEIDTGKVINTYDNWHIIPETRPLVNRPEVVTSYIEISGSDGALDFTESLSGTVNYKNRTGSWNFIVENGHQEWQVLYNYLLSYLHGHRFKISLEDDPEYEYIGRLALNEWKSGQHWSTIVINYNLSPYRYRTSNVIGDWLWDDLTMDSDAYIIYYGTFDVRGHKTRNLYNPSSEAVPVTINSTAQFKVTIDGNEYTIFPGLTENIITVNPGDNFSLWEGSGRVIISYDRGKSI